MRTNRTDRHDFFIESRFLIVVEEKYRSLSRALFKQFSIQRHFVLCNFSQVTVATRLGFESRGKQRLMI